MSSSDAAQAHDAALDAAAAVDASVLADASTRDAGHEQDASAADGGATIDDPREQRGWQALTSWDAIPTFEISDTHVFTGYQRPGTGPYAGFDPGNKDFNGFLAVCGARPMLLDQEVDDSVACEPGQEGYLIAADDGPGFMSRLELGVGTYDPSQGNDPSALIKKTATDERVRIYVDDLLVYEGAWLDWTKGSSAAPFVAPLTGAISGNTINYVPISYTHKLRVFLDQLHAGFVFYYPHVTTHSVAHTQAFDPKALTSKLARAQLAEVATRASGKPGNDALYANWLDAERALPAGASQTVFARKQPGTLQRLQITLPAQDAQALLAGIDLRVFWNAETTAAIDLPLAAIFGARQSLASFSTWPMQVHATAANVQLTTTLPMPFAKSARIELVSHAQNTTKLHVRLDGSDSVPSTAFGSLHTSWRLNTNPAAGEHFVAAELNGRGKYIGTLMFMRGHRYDATLGPDPLNFLEGDETLEVDDVIGHGSGTEECFGGGWYFADGRFDAPFVALINRESDTQSGQGAITVVRWNVLSEAVQFQDHFRLSFEYGANHPEIVSEYAAVGFYYQ